MRSVVVKTILVTGGLFFALAVSVKAIDTSIFTANTLFIEAEDADYGHGKYVTDQKIGMDGPYDGGAYSGLGTADDADFDWHSGGPDGQIYRPDTGLSAGKPNGTAGSDRGTFQVKNWWTLGWNDAGEWYNYTRDFPTPAQDYFVIGHLSSGGNPINIQLDQITSGAGQADDQQVKKFLGVFSPGRATAGWDSLELFALTDADGNPTTVNLGGKTTIRATIQPSSAEDEDYYAFIPATGPLVFDISASPSQVVLQLADTATVKIDPASVSAQLDGANVTTTATKKGTVTTVTYNKTDGYFASASKHTMVINYKDTGGTAHTTTQTVTVPTYGTLPAASAVTADTSKKGFLVRTWQSPGEPNLISWALDQLAGLHGDNTIADPSPFTDSAFGNNYFDETGTINYWNSGGEGNFPNDATQNTPGLANDGTNDDSYSLEVISYLDLPAGLTQMGVNSDDGFRVYSGANPLDYFAQNLGEFNAGRGVTDTIFNIVAEQAGVYPFRLIYEEGGGDAAVEWFTLASDGTKHLINDSADSKSIKAYRAASAPAYVKTISPLPPPAAPLQGAVIGATLEDQGTTVDSSSITMTLNGQAVTPKVTKTGGETVVAYTPTTDLTPATTYNVAITFKAGGASRTINFAFQTEITTATFVAGTLFIEAEDVDFGHGKYVKDKKIGMDGAYDGAAYKDLGTADDKGFDWNTNDNAGQAYRPDTGLAAGKESGSAGSDRGLFQVTTWWTLGWNDAGEWYNYTRDFPTPAKDYAVYGHLASDPTGLPIHIQIDQVTAGQGQDDSKQVKKTLGYFAPGRVTPGWDTLEIFQLVDANGDPAIVNLGGNTTLRATILAASNSDEDYYAFVPSTGGGQKPKISGITLSGGQVTITYSSGTLQSASVVTGPYTDVAGATSPYSTSPSAAAAYFRLRQ